MPTTIDEKGDQSKRHPPSQPPPPRRIVSQKTLALTLLVFQNASVSLLTRLSRTPSSHSQADKTIYIASVAVFAAEVIKFVLSLVMLTLEKRRKGKGKKEGAVPFWTVAWSAVGDLRHQKGEMMKLSVPACLYAVQNTLLVSWLLFRRRGLTAT